MSAERIDYAEYEGGGRATRGALAVAAVGAVLLGAGFLLDPRRALYGYLTGYAFALSLALGALVFLLIVNTMDATWPVAVRRLCEAVAGTLPLFVPLFVPILLGLGALYPWLAPAAPESAHARALLAHKHAYLNPPFFVARAALYLLVWGVVSSLLRRWSLAQDDELGPPAPWKLRSRILSAGALPPVGLTLTFASFDWLMSLTPSWSSTMYGFYYFAGGALGAMAVLVLATLFVQRQGGLPEVRGSHYYALGRLLLAFVIFWAYIAFFQFFIIWIADKPDEVPYYLARLRTSWRYQTFALAVGQFAVPFFLLLPYGPKRRRRFLGATSVWLLAFHYLDIHWLVVPSGYPAGWSLHVADAGGALFHAGLECALALRLLRGHPLVPRNDPALSRALDYRSR